MSTGGRAAGRSAGGGERQGNGRVEGEKREGKQNVRRLNLVSVLTQKEHPIINHLNHDQTEQLSEVQSRDHLLEGLLSRLVGRLVDVDVVRRTGEVLLLCLRVERAPVRGKQTQRSVSASRENSGKGYEGKRRENAPLAVDSHQLILRQPKVLDLRDVSDLLHVRGVAARSEDDTRAGRLVDVG